MNILSYYTKNRIYSTILVIKKPNFLAVVWAMDIETESGQRVSLKRVTYPHWTDLVAEARLLWISASQRASKLRNVSAVGNHSSIKFSTNFATVGPFLNAVSSYVSRRCHCGSPSLSGRRVTTLHLLPLR